MNNQIKNPGVFSMGEPLAVVIPPEVNHWHGAAKDSWFSHLAVSVIGEETSNMWLEAVAEEDYKQLPYRNRRRGLLSGGRKASPDRMSRRGFCCQNGRISHGRRSPRHSNILCTKFKKL